MPRKIEHWEHFRSLVDAGQIRIDPFQVIHLRKIGKRLGIKVGWINPAKDTIRAAYNDFQTYEKLWTIGIDFLDPDGKCK